VRVPRFEPFPALRYAPGVDLDAAAAPPYDVLSSSDVAALRARHERNIVEIDLPGPEDDPERYHRAARTMRAWEDEGTLVRDEAPTFTLYRMRFTTEDGTERETVGVLGALEVVDEGAGGVLPHERTTPKAKTDRLDLTRATEANLSPVWGLSLTAGLTELLTEPAEVVGRCTDEQGVLHTVERVTDPERLSAIEAAVAANPVLIARLARGLDQGVGHVQVGDGRKLGRQIHLGGPLAPVRGGDDHRRADRNIVLPPAGRATPDDDLRPDLDQLLNRDRGGRAADPARADAHRHALVGPGHDHVFAVLGDQMGFVHLRGDALDPPGVAGQEDDRGDVARNTTDMLERRRGGIGHFRSPGLRPQSGRRRRARRPAAGRNGPGG
jgi:hypothetical protein